jgi:23S rRNA (guanosine2251-2'-O)-methyltransferase
MNAGRGDGRGGSGPRRGGSGGSGRSGGKGSRGGSNRGDAGGQKRSGGGTRRSSAPPSRSGRPSPGGPGRRGDGREERQKGPGGDQVEGRHAVRELLLAGRRRVREVFMAADLDPAPIVDEIRELAAEARVGITELSRTKFESITKTEASQGVMARAEPLPDLDLDDLLARSEGVPFLLVLDGITDPGNLGAMLRTGLCAGVTGVVLPRHRSARLTPTVTKAAAGAIEHLPVATVSGIPAALGDLSARGVWSVGLDAVASTSVYDMAVSDAPVALVLGAEGRGLSRLARERCDLVVAIPLQGPLGSLNVGAAAAVACFEVARRRAG